MVDDIAGGLRVRDGLRGVTKHIVRESFVEGDSVGSVGHSPILLACSRLSGALTTAAYREADESGCGQNCPPTARWLGHSSVDGHD